MKRKVYSHRLKKYANQLFKSLWRAKFSYMIVRENKTISSCFSTLFGKNIIPQKRIFQKIQWLINYVHMQKYYSLPDTFMFFLQAIKWFTTIILCIYISIKKSSKCILYKFFRSLWGYVGGALPPAPSNKEFPVVMVFPLKKCTLEL